MSKFKPVDLDSLLSLLNSAVNADRLAISELIRYRVICKEKLANHPTIQCGKGPDEEYSGTVGLLGILNGIFGIRSDGYGYIEAIVDDNGLVLRFQETKREEERKEE